MESDRCVRSRRQPSRDQEVTAPKGVVSSIEVDVRQPRVVHDSYVSPPLEVDILSRAIPSLSLKPKILLLVSRQNAHSPVERRKKPYFFILWGGIL